MDGKQNHCLPCHFVPATWFLLFAACAVPALLGNTSTAHAAANAGPGPYGPPQPTSTPTDSVPTPTPVTTVTTVPPSSTAAAPTASPTGTIASTPTPLCEPRWSRIDTPWGGDYSVFQAVSAASANDVWAAGRSSLEIPGSRTLVYHWDGQRWSNAYELLSGGEAYLFGICAISANDVWAVGVNVWYSLVEHWDGRVWQVVPSPSVGDVSYLRAVAAVSANNLWAVGYYSQGGSDNTLIEHWDGIQWSVVPSPNVGSTSSQLFGVAALSANDVWAAGHYQDGNSFRTLIERWDGTQNQWTIVPSPNLDASFNELHGMAAHATNDVWAVGYSGGYGVDSGQSLILHWNGEQWEIIPSPNPGTSGNELYGVTTISGNDAWAVGTYHTSNQFYNNLTMHWDGTSWNNVYSSLREPLYGVSAVSTDELWAVGGVGAGIVERYGIPILFSDVPPANAFYPSVQCLACRGIVSGYPDGTFRPNADVTRGQLSKIVTLAAQFHQPIPPDRQDFEDVPIGSIFWWYVEQLSELGIMQGYPCGGNPSEPCVPPSNRRYFRPAAPSNRGQTAKVVREAAGFASPCTPGQQDFEDVPLGSAFWCDIQHLYDFGILSGYPCGGPGEPCVPPLNLPYYRPGRSSTRGQLAKMIGIAMYGDCSTLVLGQRK